MNLNTNIFMQEFKALILEIKVQIPIIYGLIHSNNIKDILHYLRSTRYKELFTFK